MECSTCPQTHARFEKLIGELSDPQHREMLQIWLDHWWGEVEYDIEAVMATVTPDITYRIFGNSAFPTVEFGTAPVARTMYLSQFEAELMPGCVIDQERVAFAPWGLAWDGIATMAATGASLAMPDAGFIPDALYLVQLPMAAFHPFDWPNRLMAGEHVYMGTPSAIERTDQATIRRLRGRV